MSDNTLLILPIKAPLRLYLDTYQITNSGVYYTELMDFIIDKCKMYYYNIHGLSDESEYDKLIFRMNININETELIHIKRVLKNTIVDFMTYFIVNNVLDKNIYLVSSDNHKLVFNTYTI